MREAKTQFPRGKVVRERYVVTDLLGQGGFGAVYRVHDRRVKGNVFALKEVVDPDRHQRESFLFEGEVLRRLDHPFLPRVYRVFEDEKHHRLYMLMDYIAGLNLERLRHQQSGKRFPFAQALKVMAPVIEAVTYLHAQQPPIIHRDIKPSNIIVQASGEGAVLVDFGIAKEYDSDATTAAVRHCSPGYGAPEQYVHGTSTRTDIYGLAATFYALLTGEVPVDALQRITRLSGREADPLRLASELVPELPPGVADVLQCAMEVNSRDRFETVQAFWYALRACLDPSEEELDEPQAVLAEDIQAFERQLAIPVTPPISDSSVSSDVKTFVPGTPPLQGHAEQMPRTTRLVLMGVVLLVLLALFAGGVVAMTANMPDPGPSVSHSTVTASAHAHVQPTVQPPVASPTIGVTPTVAPTVQPVTYPHIALKYEGTIHNTPAQVDSTMMLSQMKQNGAKIHGYLTLGVGLLGSGPFDGAVTADKRIHFLVPVGETFFPLYFQGQIQTDGSMSGTYCSYRDNHCDTNAGGYGDWQVVPS